MKTFSITITCVHVCYLYSQYIHDRVLHQQQPLLTMIPFEDLMKVQPDKFIRPVHAMQAGLERYMYIYMYMYLCACNIYIMYMYTCTCTCSADTCVLVYIHMCTCNMYMCTCTCSSVLVVHVHVYL